MSSIKKTPLELVLAQSAQLYSPPEVAIEVLRLTEESEVDLRAIRACLERDPALAVKLLRVVNSSLYGLSGEVNDLNQAITLLGVTPLKMLVLGFSLPDQLFTDLMADTLTRYWTETITRGAAARLVAELGWGKGGDEALLAGLMQGIGQLVLIQQFGTEYTDLVRVVDQFPTAVDLLPEKERETLGFDHRTLSAEMLLAWGLPTSLAKAIALQGEGTGLVHRNQKEVTPLAQTLRLAELVTQLVVHRRLSCLPALVEEGEAYCQLTRRQINTLVEQLQPRVDQLAEGMALELESNRDYQSVLMDAHVQLSIAAEDGAGVLFGVPQPKTENDPDDQLYNDLLAETEQMSKCVREFLARREAGDTFVGPRTEEIAAAHAGRAHPKRPHHPLQREGRNALIQEVDWMTAACRKSRSPLVLAIIEMDGELPPDASPMVVWGKWLQSLTWAAEELQTTRWVALDGTRFAMLLPGFERSEIIRMISRAGEMFEQGHDIAIDAGVSSISHVPKGFEAVRLIDAAKRCLDAALATGAAAVKSIEVY